MTLYKIVFWSLMTIIGCVTLATSQILNDNKIIDSSKKLLLPDPDFYVYLCFGQSNMEGSASIEAQDTIVDNRLLLMQATDCSNLNRKKYNWYKAIPPLSHCYAGLSPADYFGRTMLENLSGNTKVGVINIAVGGCDIRLFDKDLYTDFDSTYTESWFQDKIKAYGGNPYLRLLNVAKAAQKEGVIKGVILHQGETNTGDDQWPHYVKKIYEDLMIDLSLNPEETPLIAGEVVHADQGGKCSIMNPIINTLPEVLPNAFVISSKGCEARDDSIHFNSSGVRELGRRYALKMISIQK